MAMLWVFRIGGGEHVIFGHWPVTCPGFEFLSGLWPSVLSTQVKISILLNLHSDSDNYDLIFFQSKQFLFLILTF